MYLRGSKWSMSKRRKPLNLFKVAILAIFVVGMVYFNIYVVPGVQPIGMPTATPTRDPESYVTEADQLFKQGKLVQAIEAYQLAIGSRPNDAAVYIALARTQVWAGKYTEAQVSAENALLLNPNNSTAYAVRGWALDFQGDYLAAEAAIKRALELDPRNALAHAYYAELLADQYLANTGPIDVIEQMRTESKTALALDPGLLEAHRARGYVLEITQNPEEAISEYQAAVAIHGNLSSLYLALGRVYRNLQVYDQAVDALSHANTLNPTDPVPDYLISRIYANRGEFEKGEQFAKEAVNNMPGDPSYHGNLGTFYFKRFKYDEAIQELGLAVLGGTTTEGVKVEPLGITASVRAPEFYFTYGLVLANSVPPRCGEALQIAQQILDKLRNDEISVYNANEIIRVCTEAAATPAAPEAGATPALTPTP
jgi:tetratricopeptide (TPR) repeat protein